ncbi:MAG: glycosyltransferase family 2 protein [Chitinophagales bacterium]|nr:glycosyltransferase family 2 protein [Chitinophagales bacterium]
MEPILTIVIPCYNEEENIPQVLPAIQQHCAENNFRCIVVNDGSSDNSASELNKFKSEQIQVLHHSKNRGYGAAIKTGVRKCNTRFVVTIDSDGQHSLDDVNMMLGKMQETGADMCVGNRNNMGSTQLRNFAKSIIVRFSKMFIKIRVNDLNSGMKMYKTDVVKYLVKFAPNGMPFSDVIVLLFHQFNFKIIEVPITIKDRELGTSTINYKTAIQTVYEILYIIIHFMPLKFFGTIGLVTLLGGVAWGLPFVLRGVGITAGTALCILSGLIFAGFGILLEVLIKLQFENYYPDIPDSFTEQ